LTIEAVLGSKARGRLIFGEFNIQSMNYRALNRQATPSSNVLVA